MVINAAIKIVYERNQDYFKFLTLTEKKKIKTKTPISIYIHQSIQIYFNTLKNRFFHSFHPERKKNYLQEANLIVYIFRDLLFTLSSCHD